MTAFDCAGGRVGFLGYADLALGDRVEPVLEALFRAGGGRFSGVRYSVGYDADPTIGNSRPDSAPHMYARPEVRAGVARLPRTGSCLTPGVIIHNSLM